MRALIPATIFGTLVAAQTLGPTVKVCDDLSLGGDKRPQPALLISTIPYQGSYFATLNKCAADCEQDPSCAGFAWCRTLCPNNDPYTCDLSSADYSFLTEAAPDHDWYGCQEVNNTAAPTSAPTAQAEYGQAVMCQTLPITIRRKIISSSDETKLAIMSQCEALGAAKSCSECISFKGNKCTWCKPDDFWDDDGVYTFPVCLCSHESGRDLCSDYFYPQGSVMDTSLDCSLNTEDGPGAMFGIIVAVLFVCGGPLFCVYNTRREARQRQARARAQLAKKSQQNKKVEFARPIPVVAVAIPAPQPAAAPAPALTGKETFWPCACGHVAKFASAEILAVKCEKCGSPVMAGPTPASAADPDAPPAYDDATGSVTK
jgi:hypothetical protein